MSAMWQNTLANRFERAEETSDCGAVRIRVGARPSLHTVAIVQWDERYTNTSDQWESVVCETMEEAAEMTVQILTDSGFGTDFPTARVDFKNAESGKYLPSWAGTAEVSQGEENGQSVEGVLVEALRQNNVEMRKMFGMVTECLQSREERIDDDRDPILELSRAEVLSRAESEMTQILAEEAAQVQVEDDPLKARAGEILGVLAERFLQSPSASPRDTVLVILKSDPQLTASLAGDEEVVSLFNSAVMQAAQEQELRKFEAEEEYLAQKSRDLEEERGQADEDLAADMEMEEQAQGVGPNPMAPDTDNIPF